MIFKGRSTPAVSATAPRAGEELRSARERLGWSIAEVAGFLRIQESYLGALEDGRFDLPAGQAYAVGYLRSYATTLGLDPGETVRRFKAEAGELRHPDLTFLAPVADRGIPAGAAMLLGLILSIVVYAGWYRLSGEGRLPAETPPPIPARLAPLAETALPPRLPEALRPTASNPGALPRSGVLAAVTETAAPAPDLPPVSHNSAQAAMAPLPPLVTIAPPPPADQPRIVLRATADAWVQVRDRAGVTLLNKVLKPGESWPVPNRASLLLNLGNAAGTEIVVDGTVLPPLGGPGVVRRDVPLDPDLLKDGKVAMSATPVAGQPR